MLNTIKKAANILKNNIIFIEPLILCLLSSMLFLSFFINKNIYFAGKICLILSIILILLVFTAGWLYINKIAVLSYNEKDNEEDIANKAILGINKFFEGVGVNFLKITGVYLVTFFFIAITMGVVAKILLSTIGEPQLIYEIPKLLQANSQAEILNFVNNIPDSDKISLSVWLSVFSFITFICNFFTLLYLTVVNFQKENILISLWKTIKFFFTNLINCIGIMLFIFILNLGVNFISVFLGNNVISLLILTILLALYLNYSVLLVFCFYDEKTQNHSNCRTEFIG